MEIEDQLCDGISSTATAYSGERHVCTKIDKFQNGLEQFTKLPANFDSTGEKEIFFFISTFFKPYVTNFSHRMPLWPHFE